MKYKMVIFDLDGTLCDTLEDLKDACNYALNYCNLPEISLDDTRAFIGNGIKNLLLRASNAKGSIDILLKKFKEYYYENYMVHTKSYTQIEDVLYALKREGVLLGVLTNKVEDIAKNIIDHLFPNIMSFVYGEVEGRKKKPDPAFLLETIKQYHLKKEEVLYIGDSEVDIYTVINSGVDGVFVSYGFRKKEDLLQLTNQVVDSPLELLQYIGVL